MRLVSLKISVLLGIGCLSPFIGYFNNTSLMTKKNMSLGAITDPITVNSGGDWGGSEGYLEFSKKTMPSGDTHGTVKLNYGKTKGWKGSLIGQPTVSDDDGIFDVDEIGNALTSDADLTEIDLSRMNNLKMVDACFASCGETYLNLSCTLTNGIPGSCFNSNKQLVTADLTGVTTDTIASSAFAGCTLLKNVDLSKMTTGTIGSNAFSGCTVLDNVNLSSFNGIIGTSCFSSCAGLKQLELPAMTSGTVSFNCFAGCSLLESITFGECDPDEITLADGWLGFTSSGGVTVNVLNEDLEKWESLDTSSWGNTVTFVGYDLPVPPTPPSPTDNSWLIPCLVLGISVLLGSSCCIFLIAKDKKNKNKTN